MAEFNQDFFAEGQKAADNSLGQSVHTSKLARDITAKNIEGLNNINLKVANKLMQ